MFGVCSMLFLAVDHQKDAVLGGSEGCWYVCDVYCCLCCVFAAALPCLCIMLCRCIECFLFVIVGPSVSCACSVFCSVCWITNLPAHLHLPPSSNVLPQILNLPTSLAYPLFHKLAGKGEERVAPAALLQWASAHNLCGTPELRRAFDILRQVSREVWFVGI